MKKKIASGPAVIIILFFSFSAFSQQAAPVPAWLSDKGYWVTETQLQQPKRATIRFYNNEHVLVGVSTVSGTRLNIKKTKVKMKLKAMLEASLLQWASQQNAAEHTATMTVKP